MLPSVPLRDIGFLQNMMKQYPDGGRGFCEKQLSSSLRLSTSPALRHLQDYLPILALTRVFSRSTPICIISGHTHEPSSLPLLGHAGQEWRIGYIKCNHGI